MSGTDVMVSRCKARRYSTSVVGMDSKYCEERGEEPAHFTTTFHLIEIKVLEDSATSDRNGGVGMG